MTEEPPPETQTRRALAEKKMGFNQMRNGIYWIQRVMKQFDLTDDEIVQRLREMGTNIGATYVQHMDYAATSLDETLKYLYKVGVNSKVSVYQKEDRIYVEDKKCAFCKYQYDDVHIPGCTISIAMMIEMLARLGFHIKSGEVIESKALGDKTCIHEFIVSGGGTA